MTSDFKITKVCRQCRANLPLSAYWVAAAGKFGRRGTCIKCDQGIKDGLIIKRPVEKKPVEKKPVVKPPSPPKDPQLQREILAFLEKHYRIAKLAKSAEKSALIRDVHQHFYNQRESPTEFQSSPILFGKALIGLEFQGQVLTKAQSSKGMTVRDLTLK